MDDFDAVKIWLAGARAVHIGACLVVLGVWVFDRLVADPVIKRSGKNFGFGIWDLGFGKEDSSGDAYGDGGEIALAWAAIARRLTFWGLAVVFLSGAAWFALTAISMSGLSLTEALQPATMGIVWNQTHFGDLWKLRLAIWVVTCIAAGCACRNKFRISNFEFRISNTSCARNAAAWTLTVLCAISTAGLAWAGHGQIGAPAGWHLAADALHLVAAGAWPAGLLPFALLFLRLRRTGQPWRWPVISRLARRFSTMSVGVVLVLILTGLVNSCFLLGSIADLARTEYGVVLLGKLALFLVLLWLGATNRLRQTPRLPVDEGQSFEPRVQRAAARLIRAVVIELCLAAVVVVIVGFLGLISPVRG